MTGDLEVWINNRWLTVIKVTEGESEGFKQQYVT